MATAEVTGLPEILKKIQEIGGEIRRRGEEALERVAGSIASTARANASQSQFSGDLVNGISARPPRNKKGKRARVLKHFIVSSSPEGHLVEFGTGRQYRLPEGIKLGRPSKASGQHTGFFGEKAQDRLIAWARARGAKDPVVTAGAIAAVLEKQGGVRAHPYLFPALLSHQGELLSETRKVLEGVTK